jgi:hypothetical protein
VQEEPPTVPISRPGSNLPGWTPPPAPQNRPAMPLAPRPPMPTGDEASVVGISSDQIEDLLRRELQKLLPDLAEKIIKQEIHRMLSTEGT